MQAIILSVKPEFSKKILRGEKKIELRKKVGQHFIAGNKIYIYESSPTKMLLAYCSIDKVETVNISMVTAEQLSDACVSRTFFDTYFGDMSIAYMIHLRDIKSLEKPLTLDVLKKYNFTPPQSFCYVSQALQPLLLDAI